MVNLHSVEYFQKENCPMIRPDKALLLLASLFLLSHPPTGYAGVYQCENPQGQTVFQDRPCRNPGNTEPQSSTAENGPRQSDRHFIWKASSAVGIIHLLGSIHFGSTEMYPLPEVITQAFTASDALIVEVHTNEADAEEMVKALAHTGSYPEGETVQEHLSPENWEKLTLAAKSQRLNLQTLQSQKPWLISLTLATLAIQKSGFSPEFGIDQYFINGAEGKKPILELESAQQQIKLLSTFSTIEQNRLLEETLDQLDQGPSYFRSMLKAWQAGDSAKIKELIQSEMNTDPGARKLYHALFTTRNHAMTEKIVKFSESGKNYFVVVGAGHLVGEEGIVELLRGRGYELTQL